MLAYNSHIGGASKAEAAQGAVTHALDRNYTIVNANRIRGMVPKEEQINPDLIALGADVWLAQTFRNPEATPPPSLNLVQFANYLPDGMRPEDMNATAARILNSDGRLVLTNDGKAAQLTAPARALPNGVFAVNEDGKVAIIEVPVTVLEALGRQELNRVERETSESFEGSGSGALFGDARNEPGPISEIDEEF